MGKHPLSDWIEGLLHKRKQMPGTRSSLELTAGELAGPKGESAPFVLLRAHTARLHSSFVHRLVQPSELIREVPLCGGQWLAHKPKDGQVINVNGVINYK